MSLDADEAQEVRHACRKMVAFAQTMYDELDLADIPPHIRESMFLEWWKFAIQPRLEFPDMSSIFQKNDE